MKPGDLYIVTRVPKNAKYRVRCGDQAVLIEAMSLSLMRVIIHGVHFCWNTRDLLRISL